MAAKLNLKGYVRNLPDGRVEILVYGSEGDVGVLIQWSRMGQPPAHVVSVEVMDVTTDFPKEKFHIRRESS
jgi:acylphosphatase